MSLYDYSLYVVREAGRGDLFADAVRFRIGLDGQYLDDAPDARDYPKRIIYSEVVAPERLVFTVSDQPGEDAWEVVTVVLNDLGDGRTEMRFQQRGSLPPEVYERAGQGWSTFFDRLADRLAD